MYLYALQLVGVNENLKMHYRIFFCLECIDQEIKIRVRQKFSINNNLYFEQWVGYFCGLGIVTSFP